MASALINVPKKAKLGDVIEIKTLISHIMETGFRHSTTGVPIPRDIISTTIATESGKIEFTWQGDNGFLATASASITVE